MRIKVATRRISSQSYQICSRRIQPSSISRNSNSSGWFEDSEPWCGGSVASEQHYICLCWLGRSNIQNICLLEAQAVGWIVALPYGTPSSARAIKIGEKRRSRKIILYVYEVRLTLMAFLDLYLCQWILSWLYHSQYDLTNWLCFPLPWVAIWVISIGRRKSTMNHWLLLRNLTETIDSINALNMGKCLNENLLMLTLRAIIT